MTVARRRRVSSTASPRVVAADASAVWRVIEKAAADPGVEIDRLDRLLGRAPMTPGKVVMTRAAEDRLTAWTRGQIEDMVWPDLAKMFVIGCAYTVVTLSRFRKMLAAIQ